MEVFNSVLLNNHLSFYTLILETEIKTKIDRSVSYLYWFLLSGVCVILLSRMSCDRHAVTVIHHLEDSTEFRINRNSTLTVLNSSGGEVGIDFQVQQSG